MSSPTVSPSMSASILYASSEFVGGRVTGKAGKFVYACIKVTCHKVTVTSTAMLTVEDTQCGEVSRTRMTARGERQPAGLQVRISLNHDRTRENLSQPSHNTDSAG